MIEKVTLPGPIALDQLLGGSAPVQVLFIDGADDVVGPDRPPREPHRHDYHELILVLDGETDHQLDGELVHVNAGQALMIGRGQVHALTAARGFCGAVVRFAEELLVGAAQEASPGWMLVATERRVLDAPRREVEHVLATLRLLDDEVRRPPDRLTGELVGAALRTVLALVARWQAAASLGAGAAIGSSPDVELLRGFVRLLEAEHHRHHDAAWYAAQLHVTPNHLASVLTRLTGRSTKRMITDRLMTEVARLLRFTDLTVQQVAHRLGYDDPLYLSRAFKAHTGLSPSAWRERVQGAGPDA